MRSKETSGTLQHGRCRTPHDRNQVRPHLVAAISGRAVTIAASSSGRWRNRSARLEDPERVMMLIQMMLKTKFPVVLVKRTKKILARRRLRRGPRGAAERKMERTSFASCRGRRAVRNRRFGAPTSELTPPPRDLTKACRSRWPVPIQACTDKTDLRDPPTAQPMGIPAGPPPNTILPFPDTNLEQVPRAEATVPLGTCARLPR